MVGEAYLFKICFFCYPNELLTPSLYSYADRKPSIRRIPGLNVIYSKKKYFKLDDTNVRVVLTDISTKPVYASVRPSYSRGAVAAVFAFSKGSDTFLESAISLFHEFRRYFPNVPIAFVGLHGDSEVITHGEGQSLAQDLGVDYFEMAATDLQTLHTVLKSLLRKVIALKIS